MATYQGVRARLARVVTAAALSVLLMAAAVPSAGADATSSRPVGSLAAAEATSGVQSYVTKVYNDLFGRDPDPSGLATWTGLLQSGTPYAQVANAITASDEYRSRLITATYQRYLERSPDPAGLAFWLNLMRSGWHIEDMQAGFIASDEFYARGGGNNRGWVTLLYRSVLDRNPASSEVDWWSAQIAAGMNRGAVARGFLYSTEHLTTVVDGYYVDLLGRHIDPSGRGTWVGLIQAGWRDEEIIAGIISSPEYWVDPNPAWLAEINRYRAAAGVGLVSQNTTWNAGLEHHLTYLARTPAAYFTGAYQSLHTENPASPYYTADGAVEGGRSNLILTSGGNGVSQIDAWLAAPFHAIGILRPGLAQVAYASLSGYSALDVLGGLAYTPTVAPVLFPGNGAATNLSSFRGELPSPLETCGWSWGAGSSFGLPLIAMLPNEPASGIVATVTGPNGTQWTTSNGLLCVVDEHTYVSSDTVYGSTGAEILAGENAVVLISRQQYGPGTYTASIIQPAAAPITWTFTVTAP